MPRSLSVFPALTAGLGLVLCIGGCMGFAQTAAPKPAIASNPDWPKASPADVDSIEHIIAAVEDVVSGPARQPRDWDRMKSLFVPGARVTPVKANGPAADIMELSVEEYIARYGKALEARGYFERSTHRVVEQFGDIAHVLSTYEARNLATDAAPYVRGISSFQLLKSGNRYWIVSIYWEAEHDGLTIPAKYLPPPEAATRK